MVTTLQNSEKYVVCNLYTGYALNAYGIVLEWEVFINF